MKATSWHIVANDVQTVERDDEGLTYLWLAEKSRQAIRYVAMTRALDSNEVYIERDDQARSCYGGVRKVDISPDGLKIRLNKKGQEHLGGMELLYVTFDDSTRASYQSVKELLDILFGKESPEGHE